MHTKDAKSKPQQKSRHDQINVVFDSLRHKYGMRIDRAEVRLEADACSEAAYWGLHCHTAQLDAPDTSTGVYAGCSSTCDGREEDASGSGSDTGIASATGIRGTRNSRTQDTHALDVREYTCSDAAKQAKLLAVSNASAVTSVFPIYVICQGSEAVSDVSFLSIYRRRRSI
jgi:hypothetical protein